MFLFKNKLLNEIFIFIAYVIQTNLQGTDKLYSFKRQLSFIFRENVQYIWEQEISHVFYVLFIQQKKSY